MPGNEKNITYFKWSFCDDDGDDCDDNGDNDNANYINKSSQWL